MITLHEALAAKQAQENNNCITVADVEKLLVSVRGTTFATIASVTKVATAAAHKAMDISKVAISNVQLFNNLQEYTNVYENAVKRSAAKLPVANDPIAVATFEAQSNWFEHTDCFSVVKHKAKDEFYLYAIYNKAESVYLHNGCIVDKHFVAQYLTKSAAEALFSDGTSHNVANDVTHNVIVRVLKLSSIVSIVAQKQLLAV